MILVVAAIFATGVTVHYDAQSTIISRSVSAYGTVQTAEFVKRAIDGAVAVDARAAQADLLANGGGYPVWNDTFPTLPDLSAALESDIEGRLDSMDFNSLSGRDISWGYANLTIMEFDDNGFSFVGNKSFVVDSSTTVPQMTIYNQGGFEMTIRNGYVRLLRAGLLAAKCPPDLGTTEPPEFKGFTDIVSASTVSNTYFVSISDGKNGLTYTLVCPSKT